MLCTPVAQRAIALTSLLAALALPSLAQVTYTVDASGAPGTDFISVQAALDVAQAGDRVMVRAAGGHSYASFVLDKGVTVMGRPTFRCEGATIADLPLGETAVLTDVEATGGLFGGGLYVTNCAGTVLVDEAIASDLSVGTSEDVRIQNTSAVGASVFQASAQFVRCAFSGTGPFPGGLFDQYGGLGLSVTDSDVTFVESTAAGGWGGNAEPPDYLTGFGGTGLRASGTTRLWLLDSACLGGGGDVPGVSAIFGSNDVTLVRSSLPNGGIGAAVTDDTFPSMTLEGTGTEPGDTAIFRLAAEPGSSGRIYAGRFARKDAVPPQIAFPWYHSRERGASLGFLPAVRDVPFVIPSVLAPGTLVFAQGSRVLSDGNTQLSNGVTLVVR